MPIESGFEEALSDAHEEAFVRLCESHGIDDRHRHFLTGTPISTINGFARQNDVDLLVVGTLRAEDVCLLADDCSEPALDEQLQAFKIKSFYHEAGEPDNAVDTHVTTEVVWVMRAFTEIMVHIRELNPSMVIKDLEHESWITRAMFTSLDLRLLHGCPVPLHLVSHPMHAKPRKVLAAVDPFRPHEQFDDINGEIITAAEKLAAQCGAELHLLYAYDLSYVFASGGY
nr:hypothetical protein [Tanacetum cinerariifolium]